MTLDGRFNPPSARVADMGAEPTWGRGVAIVLGVLLILQIVLTASPMPYVLTLVDSGVLSPLGLLLELAGELCLVAGIIRIARHGHRGGRLFLAALVLLALNGLAWRNAWPMMAVAYGFGMLISGVGWLVAIGRGREMSRRDETGEAS